MLKRNLLGKCRLGQGDGEKAYEMPVLEYYIVSDNNSTNNYGICISKIINETEREETLIHPIARNRNDTEEILKLLKKNTVTPVAIGDILADMGYST